MDYKKMIQALDEYFRLYPQAVIGANDFLELKQKYLYEQELNLK
jgi:hypothetical protein